MHLFPLLYYMGCVKITSLATYAFNAIMSLSCASTRGSYSCIEGVTSYSAPPLQPYEALPRQPYPAPTGSAAYGSLAAGPPSFYSPYSAVAAHPETAPFYFSHLLPMKLARDNSLSWRAQVMPLPRSRYLEGY